MATVEDLQQKKKVKYEGDENEIRGNWSGRFDFFLSCVGYAVGLGNVWRFPYLCYKNGGGAFLIPYFIMLIITGIPLFYFELALGQFSSSGPISVWKVQPMMKGIGYAMMVVATIVSIYYNVIIAWSFYYLFASFTPKLPWSDCNNPWNDEKCILHVNNVSKIKCNGSIIINCTKFEVPAEQYWNRVVLGVQSNTGQMLEVKPFLGQVQWHLCLCLLLAWIVCGAALIKGIKSSGKVVYFTSIFPYVVIIIMVVNGCLLEGSVKGIKYYIVPQWDKLLNIQVWIDAATQIFFSLGVAFGGLLTMASYNKFKNNCYRDALLVPVINCGTSFLAGFAIFSVLGFMANETGQSVEETSASGPGLAFVAYAQSLSKMPAAPVWSILFFLMLLTLGVDSQFGGMEAIFTGLQDEFPILKRTHFNDICFKISFQILLFFLGIALVSQRGIYIFTIMDTYSGSFSLVIIGLSEILVVSYLYGMKNFLNDIKMMLGYKPGWFWRVCWLGVTPVTIMFILIASIIYHSPMKYGGVKMPVWTDALGILMVLASALAIPGYFALHAFIYGFTKTPKDNWGPGVEKFWLDDPRYASKINKNSKNSIDDTRDTKF